MIPFMSGAQIGDLAFTYPGVTAKVNSVTITVPGAVADIAFLFQFSENAVGAPVTVTPAGWTLMQTNVGVAPSTTVRMSCHMKKLVSADIGAVLTGMNGDVRNDKMIMIFRPNRPIVSLVTEDTNFQIIATVPTDQSLPAASYPPPIIAAAQYVSANADAAIAGTGFTPAADGAEDNGTHQRVLYKIYNSSPANITVKGQTDAGAVNGLQSNDTNFT